MLAAVAIVLGLVALGVLYQWLGTLRDARRFPPPGRMFDIGGRRLHLWESGAGPVVVFEAGISASHLNWRAVQSEVAQFAHCVSYDRAGLGWSDAAATPRTPEPIVAELRALLTAADIPPPYVLVGHSFGGLVVRWFAHRHPEEVAGIVLVDGLRPETWSPVSPQQRAMIAHGVHLSRRGAWLARIGVVRFCLDILMAGSRWLPRAIGLAASGRGLTAMDRLAGEIRKMPREVWPMIAAHWSHPKSFLGMAAHLEQLPASAAALADVPPIKAIPVIALTPQGETPGPVAEHLRHVVAASSGHWIHLDEPHLVVEAIRELLG